MKKNISIAFICLAILLLGTSCHDSNNPYSSPKSITQAFAQSLYTGKFDEAKKYVTPESIPIINFYQHAFPPENFEGCDQISMGEITVNEITDSTAMCKCILTLCNGRNTNSVTNVLKRDDQWFVSLRQSDDEKQKEAQDQIEKITNQNQIAN